jgi:hypothetical protein
MLPQPAPRVRSEARCGRWTMTIVMPGTSPDVTDRESAFRYNNVPRRISSATLK